MYCIGCIRLSVSTVNSTYELSEITHVTPFRKYGKHSTGPSTVRTDRESAPKASPFLQFVVTEPSRVICARTEGCHMGLFRELVGTACCTYGQSNTTINSVSVFTGLPSLWSIQKRFEQVWCLAELERPDIVLFPTAPPGCVPVLTAQKLEIDQRLYNHRGDFTLVAKRGPATKKSFTAHLSLHNESCSEQLCSVFLQYVHVNPSTKQVMEIADPAWMNIIRDTAPSQVKPEPMPIRRFLSRLRPSHSDTDCLYQVNQSAYVRFCLDAAAAMVHGGHLWNFEGDLFAYRVRQVEVLYQKEALPGDELDVNCWEDTAVTDTLHFQITRSDMDVLYCKISFYKEGDMFHT